MLCRYKYTNTALLQVRFSPSIIPAFCNEALIMIASIYIPSSSVNIFCACSKGEELFLSPKHTNHVYLLWQDMTGDQHIHVESEQETVILIHHANYRGTVPWLWTCNERQLSWFHGERHWLWLLTGMRSLLIWNSTGCCYKESQFSCIILYLNNWLLTSNNTTKSSLSTYSNKSTGTQWREYMSVCIWSTFVQPVAHADLQILCYVNCPFSSSSVSYFVLILVRLNSH